MTSWLRCLVGLALAAATVLNSGCRRSGEVANGATGKGKSRKVADRDKKPKASGWGRFGQPNAAPATTAKEYLARFKAAPTEFIPANLPPSEMKKVVADLRQRFPFESIAHLLEYERRDGESVVPGPQKTPRTGPEVDMEGRSLALKKLHSEEVIEFINREGFGAARVTPPNGSMLELPDDPIQLDRYTDSPKASKSGAITTPLRSDLSSFDKYARSAFLSRWPLGYVKDVKHVAGFRGHRFIAPLDARGLTKKKQRYKWQIRKLQLVSLLKYATPRVYVSNNLPQMAELRTAQTRELNRFEMDGLKQIRNGDDPVVEIQRRRIRMVGALRARVACKQCHAVEPGDLMGAFSYELRRMTPAAPPPRLTPGNSRGT